MKNILYIHQYFNTPQEPGGTRSYWISQELIRRGYNVTMITASKNMTESRIEKKVDGINVVYLDTYYSQSMSVFKRFKAFMSFVNKSIREARGCKDIDLVIATSTPLTVGITALYMKLFKTVPYIFEVRDLWPEVPIQMGAFKSPLIVRPTRWFEKQIYKNAQHVIALSPGMEDGVVKYISQDRVSMIPNMSKIDEFWPREPNTNLARELGLKDNSFKIIHFGALGLANGAHTLIESAALLKDNDTIEFVFVGGGSQEIELKKMCEDNGLKNVVFLGRYPMKDMSEIVNFCDVSVVSFLDLPILYTNSPNKLFDSLSAGKPIIVNSAGWTKDMVENNNCGYYVNPKKPEELLEKILHLQSNPELVKEMSLNSRILAETTYDKSHLTRQFAEVVDSLSL